MSTVLLVNKSVSERIYPVSGRSGKLYGNATFDGVFACSSYRMPLADYERDKFDLIGQLTPGQQWVPVFEADADATLVKEQIAALEQWKKEALQVLNGIQLQEIGKELGLTLGDHIGPEILPGIRTLKAQIPKPPDPLLSEHINELRRLAKKAGAPTTGGKETLVKAIRAKAAEAS